MDPELVEALKIVLDAVAECRAHLERGDLDKARAEMTDPLLYEAIKEFEIFK